MYSFDDVLAHLASATSNYSQALRDRALGNIQALLSDSSLPFTLVPRDFRQTGVQFGLQADNREYGYLLIIKTDQGGLKIEAHGDIKDCLRRHRPELGRLTAAIGAQAVVDLDPNSSQYIRVLLTDPVATSSEAEERVRVVAFLSGVLEVLSADQITPYSILSEPSATQHELTVEQLALEKQLEALGELDLPSSILRRAEQGYLRKLRLENRTEAPCDICGQVFSADLLVLAHIKPRSQCEASERRDYRHNTMLACTFGCDELFERHYVEVSDGVCVRGTRSASTLIVQQRIERLCGKKCPAWSKESAVYFRWHARSAVDGPG